MNLIPTVETLTAEILILKQQTAVSIIEIGNRLIQVKEQLPHGEWGKWLEEKVEFSDRTAQRFIRAAREFSNTTTLSGLSPSKIFALLDVPQEQREQIAQEHDLNQMSVREINELKKQLREAQQEKRAAERAAEEAEQTIRELQEELDRKEEPQVIEKTVVVEKVPDSVRLQIEALSKTKIRLEGELAKKEIEEGERLHKARLNQIQMDRELLFLTGEINHFLSNVSQYLLLSDKIFNMNDTKAKECTDALNRLDKWVKDMKAARPNGGQVIEI